MFWRASHRAPLKKKSPAPTVLYTIYLNYVLTNRLSFCPSSKTLKNIFIYAAKYDNQWNEYFYAVKAFNIKSGFIGAMTVCSDLSLHHLLVSRVGSICVLRSTDDVNSHFLSIWANLFFMPENLLWDQCISVSLIILTNRICSTISL